MNLHPVYKALLAELEAEGPTLEKKVLMALRQVMPEGLTRRELVFIVYGAQIGKDENISNSTQDRMIRKAIENLRDRLIPVVATSGAAGYRLDITEEGIDDMIRDWSSRRDTWTDKIRRAELMKIRVKQAGEEAIPEELPQEPKQIGMFR